MQKKESSLLKMAKVIVVASSFIGIITIWGISYYMLVISAENNSQIPNNQVVFTQSACAKITDNKLAQGDCYLKVAKVRKNEAICAKIEIAELKSLCFVELSELKNDFGICINNGVMPSLFSVCQDYFGESVIDGEDVSEPVTEKSE
ncbi:MAG: hypothetical protein PHX30_01965 [Candidatus Pacebacteria bacterium]|jgi:hypothetical protein|nr:hypothetical protein [Candidatus Paceibacterota bacterium]